MNNLADLPVRDRIFYSAVWLFSDYGFYNVSIRQISKNAGISVAAVYYHFDSKDSLLDEMYSFYRTNMNEASPNINKLLELAETDSPLSVLMNVDFHYPPEIQEVMDRIIIIAAAESRSDERSAVFLKETVFDLPQKLTTPLLKRMVELGRVEPVDIAAMEGLLANISFSAAFRNYSSFPVSMDDWIGQMKLVFSLIKPTGK